MTDPDPCAMADEELPDFLALGIEALAQTPEGRAAMNQVVRGQLTDLYNLFGIDPERQEPPTPDPCSTCRLRDQWCCDPWETPQDHEGDADD